jgi:hypothetical protein
MNIADAMKCVFILCAVFYDDSVIKKAHCPAWLIVIHTSGNLTKNNVCVVTEPVVGTWHTHILYDSVSFI